MGDEGIKELARIVKERTSWKEVHFENHNISCQGAKELATAFVSNTTVNVLI